MNSESKLNPGYYLMGIKYRNKLVIPHGEPNKSRIEILNSMELVKYDPMCPNCHTQTESFSGRNKAIKVKNPDDKIKQEYILSNGETKTLTRKAIAYYNSLKGKSIPRKHKVEHPSKEELEKLLWEMPTSKIAKQYGVSDKAIEKWSKQYGLSKPPRGYWQKLKTILD